MSDLKILGIIPARAGSKRVLKKNFRAFAGTTLTNLAIEQALDSKLLNKIVVNSDAEQVKSITLAYQDKGVEYLERPKELATDESPALDYMMQTLKHYEDLGEKFDLVVVIQPSSPLRSGKDIDATIRLLLDASDADSAVSVVQLAHMVHPHKLKIMEGELLKPWLVDEKQKTAAHEIPVVYTRNCAVYVFRTNNLRAGTTYGKQCLGYIMSQNTSIDINDAIEFDFAEILYCRQNNI
jgi:CMP-N-acetylneuraminic acid synthetase